jgi:peptidoglycan/LPS O-acetylase OafA/YrhL
MGVDVFFMVSGFIMYYLTAQRFGSIAYAGEFLKRRFIRVVPLYWICTALMLLAIGVAAGKIHHTDATLPRILASLLFFPTARADGLVMPVLAIGWTVNYEVFFYLLYALALTQAKRLGLGLLIAVFVVLAAVGYWLRPAAPALSFWTSPIILEFLLGMALAHLRLDRGLRVGRTGQILGFGLALGVLVAANLILKMGPPPPGGLPAVRWLWGAIPALFLAAPMIFGPEFQGRVGRILARGGDASYALYLSHPFTLNLLAALWTRLHLPAFGWLYVAVGAAACIAVAWGVHRWVETPLLDLLRRRFEPSRPVLPA